MDAGQGKGALTWRFSLDSKYISPESGQETRSLGLGQDRQLFSEEDIANRPFQEA